MNIATPTLRLGLPDRYLEGGKPADMYAAIDLDSDGITQQIDRRLNH